MAEKSEAQWAAESDARALVEALVIQGDTSRLKKAKKAAQALSAEESDRAAAFKKVAKSKGLLNSNRGKGLLKNG